MLRLIIIFLGTMFFWFCLQFIIKIVGFINKIFQNHNPTGYNHNNKNNNKNSIKDLAKCMYCGLYIPIEDSIQYDGQIFCCREHINNK